MERIALKSTPAALAHPAHPPPKTWHARQATSFEQLCSARGAGDAVVSVFETLEANLGSPSRAT
eukprot:875428-Pelagomonas_calceolata.AAC.3